MIHIYKGLHVKRTYRHDDAHSRS